MSSKCSKKFPSFNVTTGPLMPTGLDLQTLAEETLADAPDDGQLYGRMDNEWSAFNPDGVPGPAGPPGADGAMGPAGPQGPAGPSFPDAPADNNYYGRFNGAWVQLGKPVNITPPIISLNPTYLLCTGGNWTGNWGSMSYQWYVNGVPVVGGSTWLFAGYEGQTAYCAVTVGNIFGTSTPTNTNSIQIPSKTD